ncbi:hypothetical protein, partial [Paraburkholderia sp. SIMBA_054]|uniref:hypothetical protein n=1 Tax=Paraburkholderia sp. SIMBA_054 TaxID=3085795 RepID=UPI00397C8192
MLLDSRCRLLFPTVKQDMPHPIWLAECHHRASQAGALKTLQDVCMPTKCSYIPADVGSLILRNSRP